MNLHEIGKEIFSNVYLVKIDNEKNENMLLSKIVIKKYKNWDKSNFLCYFTYFINELNAIHTLQYFHYFLPIYFVNLEDKLFIMQKATNDLNYFYSHQTNSVKQREFSKIFYNLLMAVQILHELGFISQDLKPENILLNYDEHHNISRIYLAIITVHVEKNHLMLNFVHTIH